MPIKGTRALNNEVCAANRPGGQARGKPGEVRRPRHADVPGPLPKIPLLLRWGHGATWKMDGEYVNIPLLRYESG